MPSAATSVNRLTVNDSISLSFVLVLVSSITTLNLLAPMLLIDNEMLLPHWPGLIAVNLTKGYPSEE